jgi:hypothetical protein
MSEWPITRQSERPEEEIRQLKLANQAILKALQTANDRAEQQQKILLQHERRIEILEAYIRGENEQN